MASSIRLLHFHIPGGSQRPMALYIRDHSRRPFSTPSTVANTARKNLAARDSIDRFPPKFIDTFNRKHDYLRISLTERCNLRCFYCMPSEGVELSPEGKLLTNDEVLRLASLFVKNGVTKIRLTGGEPTVRKGVADIIGGLNNLRPLGLKSIAMTSNGLVLHRRLSQFIENGLSHLNLSLDTLDPLRFELITRRRGHDAVLKALDAALSSTLESVKLNVVVIKGLNEDEIYDFVELTRHRLLSVRFIEFMPFNGNQWDKEKMIPSAELLERLSVRYHGIYRAEGDLNDTARSWKVPGYRGSIGFISSMSDHFCKSCNRLRITADGQIKVCLFDPKEVSLRDEMRKGASDEELFKIVRQVVLGKKEKHAGMHDIDVLTNRPMVLIGPVEKASGLMRPKATLGLRPLLHRNDPISLRHYSTSPPRSPVSLLTHIDKHGNASMVDVNVKPSTKRTATATGRIYIPRVAYDIIVASYPLHDSSSAENHAVAKTRKKGDTLTVAQLAAIMAAKKTSDLIPLCHPLPLSSVQVMLTPEAGTNGRCSIECRATASVEGKTGVEMEALTAVSVGLLTVWDMLKAVAGREMVIGEIYVSQKSGGRSGDFDRILSL